jgi:hypothetical protein
MNSKQRRGLSRRPAVIIGVLALIGACVGCCLVSALVVGGSALSRISGGLSIHACVGLATTPRLQAGIAWYSPLSSYRGPLAASPYAVCADIPWPGMPRSLHREWMFPP